MAVTLGILPVFLAAALVVQIDQDVGLRVSQLGLMTGLFFGIGGITAPTIGKLVDRFGWAIGLRLANLLGAAVLAGLATYSGSLFMLGSLFLVGGIVSSLSQTASNLTIARCVGTGRHGLFFGLRHASVPMATLLAGLAIPAIALTVGWRWAFWGAAALSLICALVVPTKEQPYTLAAAPSKHPNSTTKPAMSKYSLILLTIAAGLALGGINAFATFLVSYSVDIGIEQRDAGLLLASGSAIGIITRVIAGWIIDHAADAALTLVAIMISLGAIGLLLINVAGDTGLLLGVLLGFGAGWGWSGLFTFAVVTNNPDAPAAATGITATGRFIGAALAPLAFGLIVDNSSYSMAWWTTTSALLIGAALIMYVSVTLSTTSNLSGDLTTPSDKGEL